MQALSPRRAVLALSFALIRCLYVALRTAPPGYTAPQLDIAWE
jgi:hypothetical protein